MKQKFKFRHADEIAGTFVICAVALFVVAIVLAGRSQGWFDGSFKLKVVFDTPDGSFGLQEGAAVQVRSTAAGRVGKISPTEGGMMGTTLVLKERFRPFITKTSIAKVKKKFGVAGDAYIEIERGSGGDIIEDGSQIDCVKDEELMDSAQNMLAEFEETMVPMLEEIEKIVKNVANILESVDQGKGIAGAVVSDEDLRDDLTQIVSHLEGIATDAELTISQASGLFTNEIDSIMNDVVIMSAQTRKLMTNEITEIVSDIPELQEEVLQIITESRRLIEGLQHHWMIRKYIKYDSDTVPLIPVVLCMVDNSDLRSKLEKQLIQARAEDNSEVIARDAYNLAVCQLAAGDLDKADELNTEARLACRTSGSSEASTFLMEAELSRLAREFDTAASLVKEGLNMLESRDKESQVEARIMLSTIYLEANNLEFAAKELQRAERLNKKLELPYYTAAIMGLHARISLREGDNEKAAIFFAQQAVQLREANALSSMTTALRQAADVYSNMGMDSSAAEYYYRTASSLMARDQKDNAAKILQLAKISADSSGDKLMIKRISQLEKSFK